MTQHLPNEITKDTIPALTQAASAVKDVTSTPSADNDFEAFMGYVERFMGHMERFKGIVSSMKQGATVDATSTGSGHAAEPAGPQQQIQVKEVVKEVGRIEPIQIYQIALAYLAQCPEDMTAREMLAAAKTFKGKVLEQISVELDAVYKDIDDAGPG